MLFDTDMLIWVQRGNVKAAAAIDAEPDRHLSLQSYMELLQCARDKRQQTVSNHTVYRIESEQETRLSRQQQSKMECR